MNLDRIRAGRSTTSSDEVVSVGTSSGAFALAAPTRVALIVSAPPTNRFTLSLAKTAVLDEGITLHPGQDPLILTLEKHGDMVTRGWTVIGATTGQSTAVIEVFAS